MAEFSICIYVKGEDGRDNLVGNSSASHAGDLGLNPKLGLDSGHTNAWMRGEEIISCKSHIAPVSLTN